MDSLTLQNSKQKATAAGREILTVKEYRELMDDYVSTDKIIEKRVKYIEAMSRAIARESLQNYAKSKKNKTSKTSS